MVASEDVTERMKKDMLRWFGHAEQVSDDRVAKRLCRKSVTFSCRGDLG